MTSHPDFSIFSKSINPPFSSVLSLLPFDPYLGQYSYLNPLFFSDSSLYSSGKLPILNEFNYLFLPANTQLTTTAENIHERAERYHCQCVVISSGSSGQLLLLNIQKTIAIYHHSIPQMSDNVTLLPPLPSTDNLTFYILEINKKIQKG